MDKVISFPIMGNYHIPANYLFSKITNSKILKTPLITSKTIELGSKYSPDFVCTPFKYTLGSFIECLDMGANTLVQMGGGCRYGYYYELQKKILEDLGYNFKYYNLVSKGHTDIKHIYKVIKEIEPNIKVIRGLYYLLITKNMVKYMDYIEDYIRKNKAYEIIKGELDKVYSEMVDEFIKVDSLYKLNNGECLNEVYNRMIYGLYELLDRANGKTSMIVSHGTSLTCMLSKWCNLKINEETKLVEIYFNNELVFDGNWGCPELFRLVFEDKELIKIKNVRTVN